MAQNYQRPLCTERAVVWAPLHRTCCKTIHPTPTKSNFKGSTRDVLLYSCSSPEIYQIWPPALRSQKLISACTWMLIKYFWRETRVCPKSSFIFRSPAVVWKVMRDAPLKGFDFGDRQLLLLDLSLAEENPILQNQMLKLFRSYMIWSLYCPRSVSYSLRTRRWSWQTKHNRHSIFFWGADCYFGTQLLGQKLVSSNLTAQSSKLHHGDIADR